MTKTRVDLRRVYESHCLIDPLLYRVRDWFANGRWVTIGKTERQVNNINGTTLVVYEECGYVVILVLDECDIQIMRRVVQ